MDVKSPGRVLVLSYDDEVIGVVEWNGLENRAEIVRRFAEYYSMDTSRLTSQVSNLIILAENVYG